MKKVLFLSGTLFFLLLIPSSVHAIQCFAEKTAYNQGDKICQARWWDPFGPKDYKTCEDIGKKDKDGNTIVDWKPIECYDCDIFDKSGKVECKKKKGDYCYVDRREQYDPRPNVAPKDTQYCSKDNYLYSCTSTGWTTAPCVAGCKKIDNAHAQCDEIQAPGSGTEKVVCSETYGGKLPADSLTGDRSCREDTGWFERDHKGWKVLQCGMVDQNGKVIDKQWHVVKWCRGKCTTTSDEPGRGAEVADCDEQGDTTQPPPASGDGTTGEFSPFKAQIVGVTCGVPVDQEGEPVTEVNACCKQDQPSFEDTLQATRDVFKGALCYDLKIWKICADEILFGLPAHIAGFVMRDLVNTTSRVNINECVGGRCTERPLNTDDFGSRQTKIRYCVADQGTPTILCQQYLPRSPEFERCTTCANDNGIWTAIGCIRGNLREFITEDVLGRGLGFAGAFALLCIIYAAISYQRSEGNPEKLKKAQELITSCIMGLMLVIFSVFILRIIGVDILKIPGF